MKKDPVQDLIENLRLKTGNEDAKTALATLSKMISLIDGGNYDGSAKAKSELDILRAQYNAAYSKLGMDECEKSIFPVFEEACGSVAAFVLDGSYPSIGHRH